MIRNTRTRPSRAGFTLIELIVVIAIIALLVALTIPAVMKIFLKGPAAQTRYEVSKLQECLQVAQQQYNGLSSLPSKLVLYNSIPTYKTATDPDSVNTQFVLQQMFGRRFLQYGGTVSWDGTTPPNPAAKFTLEGDQCLVFYLGGIPSNSNPGGANATLGCLGFSNNPVDPTQAGGQRIGPFFQFATPRLVQRSTSTINNVPAGFFLSYKDPYGTPYAFFGSNNGASSGYIDYCPTLGAHPYSWNGAYLAPSTFQIISAGPDKNFGLGGALWSPTAGSSDGVTMDNFANFTKSQLLAPQN